MSLARRAAHVGLAAIAAMLNNGFLRIYTGDQPESSDDAPRGIDLIAELRFGDPAFNQPEDGAVKAKWIKPEASAMLTGTARWYRCFDEHGWPVLDGEVIQGSVSEPKKLALSQIEIEEGDEVSVAEFLISVS